MQFNLRQLNAFQQALADMLPSASEIRGTVSVNEFDDAKTQIDNQKEKVVSAIEKYHEISLIVVKLRNLIAKGNVESGVSTILTFLSSIEKQIAVYSIVVGADTVKTIEHLDTRIEKLKTSTDSWSRTFDTGIFTREELDGFSSILRKMKKDKQLMKDRLLNANLNHMIEVGDEVVEVLSKYELI